MGGDDCQCESRVANRTVGQERWRQLCTEFYYDQDEAAKRVLEYFEASKVDEISISTEADADADAQFIELVQLLGLQKCMVPGHEESFNENIQMLEGVKSEVRAGFHAHVSTQRYSDFETRAKEAQGTNFELWTDDNGRQQLSVRVQHDYLRTIENHTKMMERMEVFLEKHLTNVGCHPFLAGLHAALQWNLESSTVVAWKISDSVFVESGDAEFTHNALALLVLALNCSHCEGTDTTDTPNPSHVKTHDWFLDPYMSDHDIRQLMRLFPTAKRLEGRPTGTKLLTKMDRANVHGQADENPKFFNRWSWWWIAMAVRRRSPLLLLLALVLTLLAFVSDVHAFGFNFGSEGAQQEHHHEHEHDHVDFYETLGLTMEATESQIKKAYRKLSLKYHPDKNQDNEEAHSRFHEISRAYEVLSDTQKRQVYDLEGFEGLERDEKSAGRPSSPFDAFFGDGGKQRGPDAAVDVPVTLEELYNGAQKQAQFARNVICRKCRGTGAKGGKTTTCKKCGGSGQVLVQQKMGPGFTVQMQQPCPKCGGRGKTFKKACPFCNGNKVVKEDKVLTAEIERGMPSTHQIVFERESEQRPGMVPGDVIFRLHQVPHDRFRRAGDDLHYDLEISLEEALLGYKKPMKHLDDRTVVLTNSRVTTPFEVRDVQGEGMPVHNYPSQRGDLHVHHEIRFPTKLSVEQKELVKQLLSEESVTAVE
ncbi:hypothetical protein KRP22_008565 [Phytophthora ramorum]|nr:DnaJ-like protein subfamily A member 1 [Phytophthora ramorum]